MSVDRKLIFFVFVGSFLLIVSLACNSLFIVPPKSSQPDAAPQAVANPDPKDAPAAADPSGEGDSPDQPPSQDSQQQPIQQPDPQPDPEPELDEVGKCVANKDIILINSDVEVLQSDPEDSFLDCHYFSTLVSEANQPVVILRHHNQAHIREDTSEYSFERYHWVFDGPIPPGGEKRYLQYLQRREENGLINISYERIFSYVAIYDTPECKKHFNSFEIMSHANVLFFNCRQYIPKE